MFRKYLVHGLKSFKNFTNSVPAYLLVFSSVTVGGFAAQDTKTAIGVVNFSHCMTESKVGKQEQGNFEALRKQMTSLLEDSEKQLNELAGKFNDAEYMDGLSPEAEAEMKGKFQMLSEEMNRYQQQYYQVLNQANMKIMQSVGANIQEASEKVAQSKHLTMIVNKEACFFHTPTLDVTNVVVEEMDKAFDTQAAKAQDVNTKELPGSKAKK